jgi:hypothetical protein
MQKNMQNFCMVRATANADGPLFTLNASVSGPAVYLDNWAIGELAEGDSSRRSRFVDAMHGMDLLFSVTNAAELSGPQGQSAEAVRTFLDEIGPRWFPVELSVIDVIQRELNGVDPSGVCISERFLKSYVAELVRNYAPESGKVISLSDDFFHLGAMLDYVSSQRESIRIGSAESDEILGNAIRRQAGKCKQDKGWLNKRFPLIPFNPSLRASFVFQNLSRILVQAGTFKKGDALDLCHAVMATAFASFATLDTHWKRRVESLPKPNQLARIYCASELDQLVTDMELWLAHRAAS